MNNNENPQPQENTQPPKTDLQPPETTPTHPPLPKKSPLVPILITTIVILMGVGGFFAFQYFNKPTASPTPSPAITSNKTPQTIAPTPTPTPEATTNPMDNWLSHTNDVMGITFKYPPIWDFHYLNHNPPSIMVAPKDITDKIKSAPGGFGGGTFLTMIISLHDYDPTPKSDEFSDVVSKSATIDSTQFTHYISTYLQDGPGFQTGEITEDYIVSLQNQWIKIGLLDLDKKEILDKIVSTIELTN